MTIASGSEDGKRMIGSIGEPNVYWDFEAVVAALNEALAAPSTALMRSDDNIPSALRGRKEPRFRVYPATDSL